MPLTYSDTSDVYGAPFPSDGLYQARRWIYDLSGLNFTDQPGEYLELSHTDEGPFPHGYVSQSGDIMPKWAGRPPGWNLRNYDGSSIMFAYPDGTNPASIAFTGHAGAGITTGNIRLQVMPENWLVEGYAPDPSIAEDLQALGNTSNLYSAFFYDRHVGMPYGAALAAKRVRYYAATVRIVSRFSSEFPIMQSYLQQFAPVLTHVIPDPTTPASLFVAAGPPGAHRHTRRVIGGTIASG